MSQGSASGFLNGLVTDAADSYTESTILPLSQNSHGRLRVVTQDETYNFASWGSTQDFPTNINYLTLCAW